MVFLIIGLLVGAIILGKFLIKKSKISSAQTLTQSSAIIAISDLSLWLEGSLEKSFNIDEARTNHVVTKWTDIKNNSDKNQIILPNGVSAPVYSEGINDVPALQFSGSNYLTLKNANFLNNSDYTIFVLEKRQSNKINNYFIGDTTAGSTNTNLVLGYDADGSIIHSQGGANSYSATIPTYSVSTEPRIFSFSQSLVGGKQIYINGILAAQSNDINVLSGISDIKIGNNYEGQIGELVFFSKALSASERRDVESYLSKKWNIKIAAAGSAFISSVCEGNVLGNECVNQPNCTVSSTGVVETSVSRASGSLTCGTGFTGSPTYTCSGTSSAVVSNPCTAITCSITSQPGINNATGLAYATTPTALSCRSGYSGSPTYTCATSGPATISGSCSCNILCGTASENGTVTITAPSGAVITGYTFVSYGTPNGTCGAYTTSSCHATKSLTTGVNSVSVPATNGNFGDPCVGTGKRLYIQATCGELINI
jgi:hypothetical protein